MLISIVLINETLCHLHSDKACMSTSLPGIFIFIFSILLCLWFLVGYFLFSRELTMLCNVCFGTCQLNFRLTWFIVRVTFTCLNSCEYVLRGPFTGILNTEKNCSCNAHEFPSFQRTLLCYIKSCHIIFKLFEISGIVRDKL